MEICIVGLPGSGKSFLENLLVEKKGFQKYTSHTTRKPRDGEVDGKSYHFVSKEEFEEMIENKRLVEWAQVYDNYYGLSVNEILEKSGFNIVVVVDPVGAESLKKINPNIITVYLEIEPSVSKARMVKRGDSKESIDERMRNIEYFKLFRKKADIVINNNVFRPDDELLELLFREIKYRER